MQSKLPQTPEKFREEYPEVWQAFARLGDECHNAGTLDERTRRLVKIALAIGAGSEGGTHSAVRNALAAGIKPEEIKHAGHAGDGHGRPQVASRQAARS